jgi:hypothetical protein
MDNTAIIEAILSKDPAKLLEAQTAIKENLTAAANKFKENGTRFVARSIFEGADFQPTLDSAMGKDKTGHVFTPDAPVTDAMKGIVGNITTNPNNSGHPATPPASFTAPDEKINTNDMFKDQIPKADGLDTTVAILTGLDKGV